MQQPEKVLLKLSNAWRKKMPSKIAGIEQGRAKFAYECALKGSKLESPKPKEYKSYVKKIPMLIKTNGLGATLAFIKSRSSKGNSENGYALINKQVGDWLITDSKNILSIKDKDDLVKKIISLNSSEYRIVTVEVLSFFNWLKRFAEGLIDSDSETGNE